MIRGLVCVSAAACLVATGCGTSVSSGVARLAHNGATPTSSAAAAPAGMQRVWLRGVGLDAPAEWQANDAECGTPVADTVILDYSGTVTTSCLRPRVKALSVIWAGTFTRPLPDNATLGEATVPSDAGIDTFDDATIDGVAVKETTQRTSDGRTLRLVLFLDRGVFVSAASPEPSVVDAAIASLQVQTNDPETGCVVHTDAYDNGTPPHQASSFALLPGDPTSAVGCVYVSGWLEQTALVTGDRLTSLMNAIRAAPPTTDQRAPDDANCESVAGQHEPSDDPPMLLRFDGPDGHWSLVAKINSCTRWQSTISSGSVTRRIDQQVLLALPQLWTVTPDPDSMNIN